MIGLVAALCGIVESGATLRHATVQWKSTPRMQVEDAYKWLFHAVQGGDHAVQDSEGPKRWMDREWSSLGRPMKGEPMSVALDPDGKLIRVNLRPYRAAGGDKDSLTRVFVESAMQFRPNRAAFLAAWEDLGERLRAKPLGEMNLQDWRRLDASASKADYPMEEHSPAYLAAYKPAYRVVLARLFEPIDPRKRKPGR